MAYWIVKLYQGSPHLRKIGRLDFSLRDHEGEVKAWQGESQQHHRDMFLPKCVFFNIIFLYYCIWSVSLLISFILTLNSCFVLSLLILYLLVLYFINFCLEICKDIWITSKCSFPSPDFLDPHDRHVWNLTMWLFIFWKATNNSSFVKIIRIQHNSMANLVQEVSVCI